MHIYTYMKEARAHVFYKQEIQAGISHSSFRNISKSSPVKTLHYQNYFVKSEHRASTHCSFCTKSNQEFQELPEVSVFQYSSTVYGNTSSMWMLYSSIICYSFICFAPGKTRSALERLRTAHFSLLPCTIVFLPSNPCYQHCSQCHQQCSQIFMNPFAANTTL